jgi:hypothetical protein
MLYSLTQIPANGKGGTIGHRAKDAGVQSYKLTNRNSMQGRVSFKSAQHDKVLDFGDTLNAAVAESQFTF